MLLMYIEKELIVNLNSSNDYGNSVTQTYEEYGDVAFFIRISDKINRLKSLTINNKTQEVKDESIADTIRDIIDIVYYI